MIDTTCVCGQAKAAYSVTVMRHQDFGPTVRLYPLCWKCTTETIASRVASGISVLVEHLETP